MRDPGWAERLRDALVVLVALGGVVALVDAVILGKEEAGLGTLHAALGLILVATGLVLIELALAMRDLVRGLALSVQLARARRRSERLQRQRQLNSFAVQFGYAAAKGVPIQQAWDEAVTRCFPDPAPARIGLAA